MPSQELVDDLWRDLGIAQDRYEGLLEVVVALKPFEYDFSTEVQWIDENETAGHVCVYCDMVDGHEADCPVMGLRGFLTALRVKG